MMQIRGFTKHHKPEGETTKDPRSAIRTDVKRAHSQGQLIGWHEWRNIHLDQTHRH
jgi:hypothetical protein